MARSARMVLSRLMTHSPIVVVSAMMVRSISMVLSYALTHSFLAALSAMMVRSASMVLSASLTHSTYMVLSSPMVKNPYAAFRWCACPSIAIGYGSGGSVLKWLR